MAKKKDEEFTLGDIQLASANPAVILPTFNNQVSREGYLPWGSDDYFPKKLLELSQISATHKQMLNLTRRAIIGQGWVGPAATLEWLQKMDDASQRPLLREIAQTISVYNGFALEVNWDKSDNKKVATAYNIPFQYVRAAALDEDGTVPSWFYSFTWYVRGKNDLSKEYKTFNVLKPGGKQVLYVSLDNIDQVYPNPVYGGALTDIQTEANMSRINYAIGDNGASPRVHIRFPHTPNEADQKRLIKRLLEQYQGPDNAGKPLISFNEASIGPEVNKMEVEPISEKVDMEWIKGATEMAQQAIRTAHGVTSAVLAGGSSGAGLSSTGDEIRTSYVVFQNTVVQDYQNAIVSAMRKVLIAAGLDVTGFGIKPFDPLFGLEAGEEAKAVTTVEPNKTDDTPLQDGNE